MNFAAQLVAYKQAIDADIAAYSQHVHAATTRQYGRYPGIVTDAFLDLLSRGGKRIRGALVVAGYEMCGGTDKKMIIRAATAIEMMHAYMLLIDDIQDRSALRRGRPTVHKLLEQYHRTHGLKRDSEHVGISLGLNAAISGAHAAHMLLAGLDVEPLLRLNALGILDHTMIITAHGQTYDLVNQLSVKVSETNINRTMEWKTAHYTFLNPLCVGMVLAGAGCESTDAIREYALHAGTAFQIGDDLQGLFGTEAEIGKDPLDDIREGKHTLVMHYALAHALPEDHAFLERMLGNQQLTHNDFKRVQQIVEQTGARQYAQRRARREARAALRALEHEKHRWNREGVDFLAGLVNALLQK